ncbi:MAG TPA: cell wall hydrolase [Ruminococcaceae bacterium]|nr:cell wall hydrolase [Oscillospiraceae bacterium]
MAYSDRELLARLIKCEAGGEGEVGMRGVATVVMNRVNASGGEYLRLGQGDIQKVIMQRGQFNCAVTTLRGAPNYQNIHNMLPEEIHYTIADWAIAGGRLSEAGDCLWFYNPYGPNCGFNFPNDSGVFHTRVNQHCFFRPTTAYHGT